MSTPGELSPVLGSSVIDMTMLEQVQEMFGKANVDLDSQSGS